MLPDPELNGCRRLLARCADTVSTEGRRLQSLDVAPALSGPCAVALIAAAGALASELLALGREMEAGAGEFRRRTGP
jgi:hypothetical protein